MREWWHLERWLHLVSSFWLPLPFLTLKGVNRGEEKSELWFLMTLHTTENLLLVSVSFLSSPDFEIHLLAMYIGIMSTNLLGLALAVFYTKKMELYSELTPDNIPNLPSFGPEVSQTHSIQCLFIALISLFRTSLLAQLFTSITSITSARHNNSIREICINPNAVNFIFPPPTYLHFWNSKLQNWLKKFIFPN